MKKATAGPWDWYTNANGIYLATPDRGHLIVMDFVRKGMNGAQPRFAVWDGEERQRMGGLMRPAAELNGHPDMDLLAAAPDLLAALQAIRPFVDLDYKTHEGIRVGEIIDAAIAKATGEMK